MRDFSSAPCTFGALALGLRICAYFISEDMRDGREIRAVRIVNSFVRPLALFMAAI